jgi:hypothetical protein
VSFGPPEIVEADSQVTDRYTDSEILQYAFDSLNKRLGAIGINLAA